MDGSAQKESPFKVQGRYYYQLLFGPSWFYLQRQYKRMTCSYVIVILGLLAQAEPFAEL